LLIKDIDYLLVLTPPDSHADYLKWAQDNNIPVMVEKPVVPNGQDFKDLVDTLQSGKMPAYAMDWEVLLATPLMAVLGKHAPFKDIVEFGSKGKDKQKFTAFDQQNITRIDATFLEGGSNPLSDMHFVEKYRSWLLDPTKGGGALYDMAVHALNTLAVLGFIPGEIHTASLGEPAEELPVGHYYKIGNKDQRCEFYARADLQSHYNDQIIPTFLEAGKGGAANDMRISMEDRNGLVINWEYGHDKSNLTLFHKADKAINGVIQDDKIIARAKSEVDPYALMLEQATCFFEQEKVKQSAFDDYHPTALYFREHELVLKALDKIHKMGREQPVKAGETISQMALEKKSSIDNSWLGVSLVKAIG
jgi:predicted dehydrogenase